MNIGQLVLTVNRLKRELRWVKEKVSTLEEAIAQMQKSEETPIHTQKSNFAETQTRIGDTLLEDLVGADIGQGLTFDKRTCNILVSKGIKTITKLAKTHPKNLTFKGFGPKRRKVVKMLLETHGLTTTIENMDLSVRLYNCLKYVAYSEGKSTMTLSDIIRYTEGGLLEYRNFGKKSLRELKEVLGFYGLRLRGPETRS